MNIRCLIIDDKPLAIDVIADYISKVPFLTFAGSTTNPIEGLSCISEQKVDLVFLDIQMPELTGLQFMKIAGNQCKVILTTAYAEYALEGFEHDVIDYLLKPVSFERFYRAAEKARLLMQFTLSNTLKASQPPAAQERTDFIFVKTEYRIQKISLKDILYIEALQNYVSIYTTTGRILSLQTLKRTEEQLPEKEFVRVSKSYVVALRHISSIERSRIFINNVIIPVGDTYRESFYKTIQ